MSIEIVLWIGSLILSLVSTCYGLYGRIVAAKFRGLYQQSKNDQNEVESKINAQLALITKDIALIKNDVSHIGDKLQSEFNHIWNFLRKK